nr:hypothetical protein [Tanacetum cinerariifolium]
LEHVVLDDADRVADDGIGALQVVRTSLQNQQNLLSLTAISRLEGLIGDGVEAEQDLAQRFSEAGNHIGGAEHAG